MFVEMFSGAEGAEGAACFCYPINVAPAFCVTHVPCRIPYLSGVQVCFVHESVKTAEVRSSGKAR